MLKEYMVRESLGTSAPDGSILQKFLLETTLKSVSFD